MHLFTLSYRSQEKNMKDIIALSVAQDIINFIDSKWRTEMFRTEAKTQGTELYKLLQKFAELPRVFFSFSEPDLEKLHFTTWMGAMALRDEDWYDNPYIADVFLLHEICHMAYATYDINLSFEDWHNKMNMEEVHASVLSEVMVYFWMPELRQHTFEHPIWADRFLGEENHGIFEQDPEALLTYITDARLECMSEKHKDSADPEMRRIAQYGLSNYEWSNIWANHHREVEFNLYLLTWNAFRNPSYALSEHLKWLDSKMENGIPYRPQAEAYANHLQEVYGT